MPESSRPVPPVREGAPAPQFSASPQFSHGGWGDLVLPRPYLYLDGDETNAIVSVGINIGTEYGGAWLSFGLVLVVPPRLFWLIDPLYRREGRPLS